MTDFPHRRINVLMAKPDAADKEFHELLTPNKDTATYNLDPQFNFEGALYVQKSITTRPHWSQTVDSLVGTEIEELGTRSSSAVLFIRRANQLFAITFGYGRFLVDTSWFIPDFGIKTALNTLDHKSLRSVDIHTLDDKPVQKKAQVITESEASAFGIDISRDILRAVTGSAKEGVPFKNICGGDAIFSFAIELDIRQIGALLEKTAYYYGLDDYLNTFSWVDNVRKVKEKSLLEELDSKLIEELKSDDSTVVATIPEVVAWDTIQGFSFTRSKSSIQPTLDITGYLENIDTARLSIESLKRDRLHVHHDNDFIDAHSMYKCFYLEITGAEKSHMLFGGHWYEIDNNFMGRINAVLSEIQESSIPFPEIKTWEDDGKQKIEHEGDYNERAAAELGHYLLDKKLVKSNRTTSAIELCDLLTANKQLVHAKHRKGGSAGLSHLFAQGAVSAEIMLGDREFRKQARKVLGKLSNEARELIPLDNLKSENYEVVYLILGETTDAVKDNLPFFSKVNLSRAYEGLSQRGFKVTIAAAKKLA